MQRAVLTDNRAAVDADEFAAGKRLAYYPFGLRVKVGLAVCGVDYGSITKLAYVAGRRSSPS